VVRAPLTGIVLVIEMTASVAMLLPMLGACFVAMLVPVLLRNPPIYDSLREITLQREREGPTSAPLLKSEQREMLPPLRGRKAMDETLARIWDMLTGRDHGPLSFRLIIQPLVACSLAIRAGLQDARTGRPVYGWTVVTDSTHRAELFRAGWKDVGRLFIAAVIIDMIYEIIVSRWIYPGQALIVAATVAIPPYLMTRGLTNRIARHWLRSGNGSPAGISTAGTVANRPDGTND
jgi:hypothetical protein